MSLTSAFSSLTIQLLPLGRAGPPPLLPALDNLHVPPVPRQYPQEPSFAVSILPCPAQPGGAHLPARNPRDQALKHPQLPEEYTEESLNGQKNEERGKKLEAKREQEVGE